MKKALVALCAAFALGGAAGAENYTKGIDLHFCFPVIGTMKLSGGFPLDSEFFESGFKFKVATYDSFSMNKMFGIYASVGVSIGALDETGDGSGVVSGGDMVSGEFMIGPAFGCDLTDGLRFQTGLAFHAVFVKTTSERTYSKYIPGVYYPSGGGVSHDSYYKYYTVTETLGARMFGMALTPQFRFGAGKRVAFLVGCDLVFDFPKKFTAESRTVDNDTLSTVSVKEDFEYDDGFRFCYAPYIGLGINF